MTDSETEAYEAALRAYLTRKGFNPDRFGNWDTHEGIGLACDAFRAGWNGGYEEGEFYGARAESHRHSI